MDDRDENRLYYEGLQFHQSTEQPGPQADKRRNEKDSDKEEGSSDGEKDQKEKGGDEEHHMPPGKKRRLIIIAVIVGLVLIIGCLLYYFLYARHYEDTDDAFIDGHVSQVSPRISGQIISLKIIDNQHVEEGQLLAEIDPRDYEVRLMQAEAQLAQANAQVVLQKANIKQAQANVLVAEAQAFEADKDYKRFTTIDVKAITREQRDTAIANAKSADARLEASRQQVEAARAQEGVAEASAKQADADVKNAELQLSYTKIVAPISGRVTRRTVEVGNVVSPVTPLMAVASNDLWVTANFKETQLTHMRAGEEVRIEIDAYPDVKFKGHVDSFQKGTGAVFSTLPAENATGNYVKVVQRVPVKILFDDTRQRDRYPLAFGLSVVPRVKVQ